MLRTCTVGLSFLGFAAGLQAGPPSAFPIRSHTVLIPATSIDAAPVVMESVVQPPTSAPQAAAQPATPALQVVPQQQSIQQLRPAPQPVQQATPIPVVQTTPTPIAAPRTIVAQPCPCCEPTVRPGRVWLDGSRPVVIDDRFRYEPRIRDIRYAVPSSTLPGGSPSAIDTPFVIPNYRARDGYFRIFDLR